MKQQCMFPSFQQPNFPPQMYGQGAPQYNLMGQPIPSQLQEDPRMSMTRGSPPRDHFQETHETLNMSHQMHQDEQVFQQQHYRHSPTLDEQASSPPRDEERQQKRFPASAYQAYDDQVIPALSKTNKMDGAFEDNPAAVAEGAQPEEMFGN